jgi:hypothetical protein
MSNKKLETEVSYSTYLSEKYENEKRYSKYMEASSLMAHNHIGRLQAMLLVYSYNCTDAEKEEMKKFLSDMENERSEFYKN